MLSRRITTSRLCSTRRLAFSMTISATCTWRDAGSSNVELTTSPFTERCMSVTSSGRSSMRVTIGVILGHAVGNGLEQHRLTSTGRGNDQAALPFAYRRQQVHDARRAVATFCFQVDTFIGVQRREVVEEDFIFGELRVLIINRFNLEQGKVPFALFRRPYLARHGITGVQIKAPNL